MEENSEGILPENIPNESQNLDDLLALGAHEVKYGNWDGVPVLKLTFKSDSGDFAQPFGLRHGIWIKGWPSTTAILSETLNVSKEEFDDLVKNPRQMGQSGNQ